jgi:hypothetical protein
MELYGSRLKEMRAELGEYSEADADAHNARFLLGASTDAMLELRESDRRRIHNLKYFTWVEQQGKTYEEINRLWDEPEYWTGIQQQVGDIDAAIEEFNRQAGVSL